MNYLLTNETYELFGISENIECLKNIKTICYTDRLPSSCDTLFVDMTFDMFRKHYDIESHYREMGRIAQYLSDNLESDMRAVIIRHYPFITNIGTFDAVETILGQNLNAVNTLYGIKTIYVPNIISLNAIDAVATPFNVLMRMCTKNTAERMQIRSDSVFFIIDIADL